MAAGTMTASPTGTIAGIINNRDDKFDNGTTANKVKLNKCSVEVYLTLYTGYCNVIYLVERFLFCILEKCEDLDAFEHGKESLTVVLVS